MKPGDLVAVEYFLPPEFGYNDITVMVYRLEQINPNNILVQDEIEGTSHIINILSQAVIEVRTITEQEKTRHEMLVRNKGEEG